MRAVPLLFMLLSTIAFAAGPQCPNTQGVNKSGCQSLPESEKKQCESDCDEAKTACDQAQESCDAAKSADAADQAKGASDSSNAGNSSDGQQGQNGGGGTQAPNAANMCAGQQANQNRAKDNAKVPGDEAKCGSKAAKCKGQESKGKAAAAAAKSFGSYIAGLNADAAQMGQQCQKSKDNESKMPQMPQIPQMPQNDKKGESGSGLTDTNGNLDTGTSTDTNSGATKQVESVNFGDSGPMGGVSATQTTPPSGLSGSQAPGFSSGAGATGLQPATNTGFATPNSGGGFGMGGNYASSSGNGAALGSGSTDGKSSNGIAAADIKPESSNVGEINYGSGGKSVLGLKSGHGGDDEEKIDPKDAAAKAIADAKREPSGAGGAKASATNVADDGTSLFTMIHNRIRNLKELGSI